jgi:hypothetical protein
MGIDIQSQRNSLTCAAIDASKKLLFCDSLSLPEWENLLTSYQDCLLGVNSPLTMNLGYMADEEYRGQLVNPPSRSRYTDLRVCEYQLICQGISLTRTPKNASKFSPALQRAYKFASELGMKGFQFWPFPNSRYQMFEINADAAYWSLLNVKPFSASSLEGRIQRQLCLQSNSVAIKDPMEFFEEITRHRLLSGKLPDEMILPPTALNALVGALTAWVIANRPAEYKRFGEADEGVIYLPLNSKNL